VVFPDQIEVAHQAGHENDVLIAFPDDLVGDVDAVLGQGIPGLRDNVLARRPGRACGRRIRCGTVPCRAVQGAVLAQDAGLQVAQVRTGLDGQLGDQDRAQVAVSAQRVRLAAHPVKGEHPLEPEPFAERMSHGERLKLRDELPVPAAGQQRLGSRFERGQALLLQPACLRARERHEIHIRKRGPAPLLQGFIEPLRRDGGIAGCQWPGASTGYPERPPFGCHLEWS